MDEAATSEGGKTYEGIGNLFPMEWKIRGRLHPTPAESLVKAEKLSKRRSRQGRIFRNMK